MNKTDFIAMFLMGVLFLSCGVSTLLTGEVGSSRHTTTIIGNERYFVGGFLVFFSLWCFYLVYKMWVNRRK